jgi:hypothetical protein
MVNKQDLINLIQEKGWKKIRQDSDYLGHRFHVVGERRLALANWHILFAFAENLDKENVEELKKTFVDVSKKSKSWFFGKWFLFYVVADRIDLQIVENARKDIFGSFHLSFDTKKDYFIFAFSTLLILILASMLATFSVWKEISWDMVYANSFFALSITTIIVGSSLASKRGVKGGGGYIFLLDLNEKKIHGEGPTALLGVPKYLKELNETLQKSI